MRGVRRKEKADIVMKKVLNSLDSAQCKEEWFREFTELFAAEDAYHEIAERMTEFYEALRMIDDTTTTISSGRFPSGCIIDVDDMNMLYSTLKITPQPSEKFLICHCSFQTDLTIRIYPLVSPGPGWFERFGRGYVFVWGAAFGAGIGGPIGAAIGGVVMDKLFGQHLGEGSYVDRSAMVTITARELSQAIPNKGIDDKKTKKVYTFVPNLQDRIDYPE
ncbi:hypothetical protein GBAR_LOCUS7767 [Geodia barretti]|uniref:Uncharacterized protein n=2 Tax=Geodia barretti TaxID=519541 RepID=A0AA35RIE8_GEOBA|nr:hypothetical protein GBAR_LOCUS7767 [Geodia barretti]